MFQLMMQQVLSIRSPLANGRWSIAMAQSQWHSRITAQPHNRAHACLRGHGVWGGGGVWHPMALGIVEQHGAVAWR